MKSMILRSAICGACLTAMGAAIGLESFSPSWWVWLIAGASLTSTCMVREA